MEVKIGQQIVLMDEEDYRREFIPGRSWQITGLKKKPYLDCREKRFGVRSYVKFHRLITGAKPGQQVDHINGNSLDNRRENLRLVSCAENSRNVPARPGHSSRFKGVGWSRGAWRVRIRVNRKHIIVGAFKDEVEAAFAYDIASLKYHGEYGRRNFLPLA